MAVTGGGAFIGLAAQRDGFGDGVGPGIYDLQRMLGFDGGESAPSIGLGAYAVNDGTDLEGGGYLLRRQVDDGDVVALAVGDIEHRAGLGGRRRQQQCRRHQNQFPHCPLPALFSFLSEGREAGQPLSVCAAPHALFADRLRVSTAIRAIACPDAEGMWSIPHSKIRLARPASGLGQAANIRR